MRADPRRRLLLTAALITAACKPLQPINVTPPEDVAFAAIVTLAEDETIKASSALTPWSPSAPFPIFAPPDHTALILGYTAAQIDAAGLTELIDSTEIHLRAAGACEPKLPDPRWLARWSPDTDLQQLDPTRAPAVASVEVEPSCPEVSEAQLALETTCLLPKCRLVLKERTRCKLLFDSPDCPFGQVKVAVGPGAEACFELLDSPRACTPSSPTIQRCTQPETCELELHLIDETPEPPFTLERLKLFDAPPYFGRHFGNFPLINPGEAHSGYANDLIIAGDTVVAGANSTQMPTAICETNQKKKLYFFDVAAGSATPARTATAPPCLERFLAHPDGDSFYATYLVGEDWHLGRLDLQGRIIQDRFAELRRADNVKGIELAEGNRLAVLTQFMGNGQLALYDALTLQRTGTVAGALELDSHSMVKIDDRRFATVDQGDRVVELADLRSNSFIARIELPPDEQRLTSVFDITRHPPTGKLLIGSNGHWDILIGNIDGPFRGVPSWEHDFAVQTTIPWPKDQDLILSGGISTDDARAIVVLFDPTTARFQPGRYAVGHGVIGRMRVDRYGRIWALLPWAAELVVMTPK